MKKIAVFILAVLSCLGVFAQVEFPSRYYVDRDNYSVSDLHTAMNQKEAWAYYEYGNYLYTMYKYENNGYAQLGFKRYYMQAANMGYEKAKIALSQFEDGGVDIISGGNNHNVMLATIEFLSASKTSSTSYNLRAGIKSDTKITNVSVIVNNVVDDRGIHSVVNDGYDFTLNKNLTLNYGNNTITVSVTNSSGTTSKSLNVYVSGNNSTAIVTEKRVALVIGNSNYYNSPLKNPINDATDIAAKLKVLGFDVTLKTDLTNSGFENVLKNFKVKANNSDIALLYYAGHGMEIEGTNYLIPIDAPIDDNDQLKYKSVNANFALDVISGAKKKIIILDACRNNPTRSVMHGGLGVMSSTNAFFAYSTSPGKTAPDGTGRNSPYTSALLTALGYKNLTLPQLFQKVSQIVTSKNRNQIPWTSSSLVDDVILNR